MIIKIKDYFYFLIFLILISLVLIYIIEMFFGEKSFSKFKDMKKETLILESQISNLKENNKVAKMELDSLTNDPDAIEGYVRNKMNMIKKGEVLVELLPND